MEFTPANKQDIQKYYLNTYVKFKSHAVAKSLNPDTLFFIEHADSQKVTGKSEPTPAHPDGEPFVIWLSDTYPFDADYVLPHKSFFQMGKHAVLLERIPAQQYFRGLHPENTKMTYLGVSISTTPKSMPIGFETLKAYVTKQSFFSLTGAIAAENCISCVLTPRMQYHRAAKKIFVDHTAVAKVMPVSPQENKIVMFHPIFKEEVEAMLKANGESEKFSIILSAEEQKKKVEVIF